MRTDHVNSSATSPHHPYFFPEFFPICFIWNDKIYHIWLFLVFIPVTGFQCHSIPVNSGDCSGEITGISKFCGRSENLAGKFHWNGTGIHWNDWNPAGICGASLRPRSKVTGIINLSPSWFSQGHEGPSDLLHASYRTSRERHVSQKPGIHQCTQYFTIPHIIHMDSTGLHWTPLDSTGLHWTSLYIGA